MAAPTFRVRYYDLVVLGEFVEKERLDWPAVFSCNAKKEIWPWVSYGYSWQEQRNYCQGKVPLLDKVVQRLLRVRPFGARFFIDERGVLLKHQEATGRPPIQAVEFELIA